jgi:hypothetical protein
MADIIQKQFNSSVKKDIKYINRDFNAFRDALMQYAQTYFPNSYKDFSAASPGTMFIEQAAYVGDVLSYYGDYQLKESLLNYAGERKNVIALANYLGYKTKPVKAAVTSLDVYQLVPSIKIDNEYVPDDTYGLSIREYMQVSNSSGVNYITTDPIDFSTDTKSSPRESTVYSRDDYGIPQFFLLKKTVKAISGKITTISFNINAAIPYLNISFPETNVIDVLDVRDSDNNRWYQVDYLAQDLIFTEEENTQINDGILFNYNSDVSKLLKTIKSIIEQTKKHIKELNVILTQTNFSPIFHKKGPEFGGVYINSVSNATLPLDIKIQNINLNKIQLESLQQTIETNEDFYFQNAGNINNITLFPTILGIALSKSNILIYFSRTF